MRCAAGGYRKMAAGLTAAPAGACPKRRSTCSAPAFALLIAVAIAVFGQFQVSAVDVQVNKEYFVDDGSDLKLACSFTTTDTVTAAASVTWTFKQLESTTPAITLLYFSDGKTYPGSDPQFKDRVTWAGDLFKNDASIKIVKMSPSDNGTYYCDVKNPPDIVVRPGAIEVRVLVRDASSSSSVATTTTTTTTEPTKSTASTSIYNISLETMAQSKAVLFSLFPFLFTFSCIVISYFLF